MILVTGANGFVGQALVARLVADGAAVRACVRRAPTAAMPGVRDVVRAELDAATDWRSALAGVDVVVHLAARVHVMRETADDALGAFRRVNVDGTVNLVRQAAAAGVRRFVFVSSVKVHGESTAPDRPFREQDAPAPQDAYGISKMEAEAGLRDAAGAMEWVVIRPPLVYGPGVKANFSALAAAVRRGWLLPVGAIDNQRSLVALDNLVDMIVLCTASPRAARRVFLVSDGEDLSTPGLVRGLAWAQGVPARMLPVPVWLLRGLARLLGKGPAIDRLAGNLQVDIAHARTQLGWSPPVSVAEGLRRACAPPPQR